MRVLLYKRTHVGDPTPDGLFGVSDCMGVVRARRFDAVIGVGGLSAEPRAYGIDRRLNWVGVGARRRNAPVGYRGPIIEFEHFRLLEAQGPRLEVIAPALAHHLFAVHRRVVMSDTLSPEIRREINHILQIASNGSDTFRRYKGQTRPPSASGFVARKVCRTCKPVHSSKKANDTKQRFRGKTD